MSPARYISQDRWNTVRGIEERDEGSPIAEDSAPSPWDTERRVVDVSTISLYNSGEHRKTGKPHDSLAGANDQIKEMIHPRDISAGNMWLRAGTVFFMVLSVGLILILISRALLSSTMPIP